jgi:hypothetical protein
MIHSVKIVKVSSIAHLDCAILLNISELTSMAWIVASGEKLRAFDKRDAKKLDVKSFGPPQY